MRGMSKVAVRDVRVMSGRHVVSRFVMLRRFAMVLSRVLVVLGRLMMVRSALVIIHGNSPLPCKSGFERRENAREPTSGSIKPGEYSNE
jgi:hypothetical protein